MNNKSISSNRSFGIVFFIVFLIISIFPLKDGGSIRFIPLFISAIFLILGLLNSKILSPLNRIWFKFGVFLGNFIAPIVMGIIYFLVVTPTGLIMRLFNKDLINLKKNDHKTYWVEKKKLLSSMKDQF